MARRRVGRRSADLWEAPRHPTVSSVLILESYSAEEWYDDWREGRILADMLRILGIGATAKACVDREQFERAIDQEGAKHDVVHVCCHGHEGGIGLTTDDTMTWHDLAEIVSAALHQKILVLSSCMSGGPGLTDCLKRVDQRPGIIIGTREDIPWDKAVLAWQLMYKLLADRRDIRESIDLAQVVLETKLVYRRWDKTRYVRSVWKSSLKERTGVGS